MILQRSEAIDYIRDRADRKNTRILTVKVMQTLHRTYDTIKRRRIDWWERKEGRAARQRDEARWQQRDRERIRRGRPVQVRGHLFGPEYCE